MSDLSEEEARLLKPCLKALVDLAEGRRKPESDAQRSFLECSRGLREPVTEHEIAFAKWRDGQPDLDAIISGQMEHAKPRRSVKKKRKKSRVRRGMSAAEAKKPMTGRWSDEEIAAHHKKSGYNKRRVRVVQGGAVNPR